MKMSNNKFLTRTYNNSTNHVYLMKIYDILIILFIITTNDGDKDHSRSISGRYRSSLVGLLRK